MTFQPESTELQLRGMLADLDAEIIAGPSAQGGYTIRVEQTAAAEIVGVLEQLRANTDVVRFATELE